MALTLTTPQAATCRALSGLEHALAAACAVIEPGAPLAAAITELRERLVARAEGPACALRPALQATMAVLHRTAPSPASREALAALREALMGASLQLRPAAPASPPRPRGVHRGPRPVVRPRRRTTPWGALLGWLSGAAPLLGGATSPSQLLCLAGLSLLSRLRC